MPLTQEQFMEALVDSGGLSQEQFSSLANSAEARKHGIDGAVVLKGILTDEQVGQLMANWFNVRFVNLRRENVTKETLKLLPEQFARAHRVLPLKKEESTLLMAASEPNDIALKALLEKYLRIPIEFVYASPRDIDGNMFRFRDDPKAVFDQIIQREGKKGESQKTVDLVDAIFEYAYQFNASDIHIEPEDDYTLIRFRIDGILHDISKIPQELHESIVTRLKVLSRLATDEHRKAQDGKIEYISKWGDTVEIRISIVPITDGEKSVMRLLSDKSHKITLKDLGMQPSDLDTFQRVIEHPWGMILVTGPTGSGKSTTLYAALRVLNKREVNISTIEDPVEYDMEGVNQIQVNEKTDLTFASGLRSLVRQDPDIIMVGEIRDRETSGIAINAAMTGHLVFSTLHTNDSATAFPRLLDMGAEDFLISSTVLCVIAQRLVRKICSSCIASYQLSAEEKEMLSHFPDLKKALEEITHKKKIEDMRLFKGRGCKTCNQSGYHGRTGIFELLEVDDEIRKAIMDGQNANDIKKIAMKNGMKTMVRDGLEKAVLGRTTIQEVLRVIQS